MFSGFSFCSAFKFISGSSSGHRFASDYDFNFIVSLDISSFSVSDESSSFSSFASTYSICSCSCCGSKSGSNMELPFEAWLAFALIEAFGFALALSFSSNLGFYSGSIHGTGLNVAVFIQSMIYS